jgi:hypothetical protein
MLAFSSALARAMNLPRAMEVVPDSVTSGEVVAPDSVMKLAHAMEMAPQDLEDSMTPQELGMDSTTPQESAQQDSLPPDSQPHPCVRCGMTHDCNDVEGCCRLAASLASAPVEIEPSKTRSDRTQQNRHAKRVPDPKIARCKTNAPKCEQERPKKTHRTVPCKIQNACKSITR